MRKRRQHPKPRPSRRVARIAGIRPAGGAASGSLPGGPASTQKMPYGSVASYLIALSQTDSVEQIRWMQAMDARAERADRRSRGSSKVEGRARGTSCAIPYS